MPTWSTANKGRMENPKRKKLKHLRFAARIDSNVASKIRNGDKVLNSELRREFGHLWSDIHSQNQGG